MATVRFTAQERDMPIPEAMRDARLRSRILQHVARLRGISTGDAQRLVEHDLYRELGINPGWSTDDATLGQALDHLDSPHFDGPASGSQTRPLLDRRAGELFADNPTLDRVLKAVSLEQQISYVMALERLHREYASRPNGTVSDVLEAAGVRDPGVLRALDAAAPQTPTPGLSPEAQRILDRIETERPRDTAEFLALLAVDESSRDLDLTAHTEVARHVLHRGDAPAAESASAAVTSPGVTPGSSAMHQRVQARLKQLGRPDSDYPRALEEIMAEERDV